MSQRVSRKRSATISSCHCCDGESTCSAVNSRTTQSGVSRVAASNSTVSTDTITSSGTFDNIMSSAGVNMDNISSLPNDSIITNCVAAAIESGSRTHKHSKHSKSRKKTKTTLPATSTTFVVQSLPDTVTSHIQSRACVRPAKRRKTRDNFTAVTLNHQTQPISTQPQLTIPVAQQVQDQIAMMSNNTNMATAPTDIQNLQFGPPQLQQHHVADSTSSSDDSSTSSDEDNINTLGQNFVERQYTPFQGINMGSTQPQYVEPISTPISQQVSNKIKKKIWKNQYIDLGSLLPRTTFSTSTNTNFSLQLDAKSTISLVPNQNLRKIYTIEQWTTAFIRFTAIYAERFPVEAPQLLKYAEIVRDLARRNPGQAWLVYDQQFRMLRENHLIPWDRLHTEFWLMSANAPFQTRQARSQFRSFRPNRFNQNQTRNTKFIEQTCWTYNRRGFCGENSCKFQHRCGFCRGSHSALRCRINRNTTQQGNTSNPNPRLHTANTVTTVTGRANTNQAVNIQPRHT